MRVLAAACFSLTGMLLQGCSSKNSPSPAPSPGPGPSPSPTPGPSPGPAPGPSYECSSLSDKCVQCSNACGKASSRGGASEVDTAAFLEGVDLTARRLANGCVCEVCSQGHVVKDDGSCEKATTTAPLVFYAYYAKDDEEYAFANQDAASALGVIEYLHREVAGTIACEPKGSKPAQPCKRHYCIDRIHRQKITMFNPPAVYAVRSGQFGPWNSFDQAMCNPPDVCQKRFESYGYNVGCMKNTYDPPFNTTPMSGGNYYDFPGPCPGKDYMSKDDACVAASPGGQCASPNGTANCTWAAEDAGFVLIDDLVGITNMTRLDNTTTYKDFHDWCTDVSDPADLDPRHASWKGPYPGGEWDKDTTPSTPGKKSLPFWQNPGNYDADMGRAQALQDLFKAKFPDSPRLPEPVCDY